jgi:protein TonB
MTTTVHPQAHHSRIGELTLWSFAAVSILSVHAVVAAYLMREPDLMPSDGAPPAAIMIELAPEPEAVETAENIVSQEVEDSPDNPTDSTEPVEEIVPETPPVPEPVVEEPTPEPVVEPEPVEETAQPVPEEIPEPIEEIDPVEQQMMAALENVEVPLPVSRPPPPVEEKQPEKKLADKKVQQKKPEEKKAPLRSVDKTVAKAETAESNRNAAQRSSIGSLSSSASPAKWQSKVASHLKRRMKYPTDARRRKEEGTVSVKFSVDDAGNVLSVSLARSSGFPELDAEILSLVRRASPVPAPPADANKTLTAPMTFELK